MRVTTRRLGAAATTGLALVLSACGLVGDDSPGDSTSTTAAGPQGAITVGGCNPPDDLTPAATNTTCGGNPLQSIFSMLVRYDGETGEAVNEIASSITSDDNVVWTIELQDGWTFHDGTRITAQSFVDAWNWAADGGNATVNASFFRPIEGFAEAQENGEDLSGLEVLSDRTFRVTLSQPEATFEQRLGYTAYAPLPEAFYDDVEAFGEQPIGSGPFVLEEWAPSSHIRLSAYEGYRGEIKSKVADVTYKFYEQSEAEYADLLADNVDVVIQLPGMALTGEAYKSDLGDRYLENEAGAVSFIGMPPPDTDPGLDNPKLRQAISMAINRQLIIDNIFQGTMDPATGWVSPVVDGFVADQCGEYCTYDQDRAQELLDESGASGSITLTYNGDGDHAAWVRAACNSINNTLDGVECQPEAVALAADFFDQIFAEELTGMFRIGWNMDYPSIENFLSPLYSDGGSANLFGYDNPDFDSLLREAATEESDRAEALYQEAERMLAETMPTIPLWYDKTVAGYSSKIDGSTVQITPFRTLDLLTIATR